MSFGMAKQKFDKILEIHRVFEIIEEKREDQIVGCGPNSAYCNKEISAKNTKFQPADRIRT